MCSTLVKVMLRCGRRRSVCTGFLSLPGPRRSPSLFSTGEQIYHDFITAGVSASSPSFCGSTLFSPVSPFLCVGDC